MGIRSLAVVCLVTILGLGLGGGCVTTAEQGRLMELRIRGLETQLASEHKAAVLRQEQQQARLREGLALIDAKIAEVGKAMDALGLSAHKSDANFGATLDGMLAELQRLRGEVEELKHAGEQMKLGLEDTHAGIESAREEARLQIEAIKGDEAIALLQVKNKAKRLAEAGERGKLVNLADGKLKEGEYELARSFATLFLKRWPKDKQAGGAQLIVAESFFRAKQYRPAILEYDRFRKGFPEHPYLPGALLNIGECFAALGMKPQAKAAFDELIRTHKKSAAASRARRRKKELKLK